MLCSKTNRKEWLRIRKSAFFFFTISATCENEANITVEQVFGMNQGRLHSAREIC